MLFFNVVQVFFYDPEMQKILLLHVLISLKLFFFKRDNNYLPPFAIHLFSVLYHYNQFCILSIYQNCQRILYHLSHQGNPPARTELCNGFSRISFWRIFEAVSHYVIWKVEKKGNDV